MAWGGGSLIMAYERAIHLEEVDTAAARLFWNLAEIMKEVEIPLDEQATYAPIVLIRLAGWLLSHGLDREDEVTTRALLEAHVKGLRGYVTSACDLFGEEGESLERVARRYFEAEGGGIPKPQGRA